MNIQEGDLIGTNNGSLVSALINVGTYALPYPLPGAGISHVAIVSSFNGKMCVFESTSLNETPCLYAGKPVSGTQVQTMDSVLARRGNVYRYPLRRPLYHHERGRLRGLLLEDLGKQYDYLGAFRSGGFLFRLLQGRLRDESLDALFCSEWVGSVLRLVGLLSSRNVSMENPNSIVRDLYRSGIYGKRERIK